jgi:GH18 family chitinase
MYQFDGLDLDWEPTFPLEPSKVSGYAELCLVRTFNIIIEY